MNPNVKAGTLWIIQMFRLLFLNSNWPQLKLGNLQILSSELRLKLTFQKRLLQLPKLLEIQGRDSEVMCGVLLLSSRSLSISVSGATRLLRVEALASDRASLKACRTVLWAKLCDENWWRKNTATPHLLWKYQEIWAWACPISMTIASNAATRCWQVAGMWIFIPYPTKFQELVKHFFLKKCKPSCIFQSWWRL